MDIKKFTPLEKIIISVIILGLAAFVYNQTAIAFNKSRDQVTKDNIKKLSGALEILASNNIDLLKEFPNCITKFCTVDESLIGKFKNDATDPPSQIFNKVPQNYRGESLMLKIKSPAAFIVMGTSAGDKDLCWIDSGDPTISNFNKDVAAKCLE